MGVGVANHAAVLKRNRQIKRANYWAKLAEDAWLKYFGYFGRGYYDPHLWYALALGVQGRASELNAALEVSRKIARRSPSHPIFHKIRVLPNI